jgi:hypothetical protein
VSASGPTAELSADEKSSFHRYENLTIVSGLVGMKPPRDAIGWSDASIVAVEA